MPVNDDDLRLISQPALTALVVPVGLLVVLVSALFVPVLSVVVGQPIDYGMRLYFAEALHNGTFSQQIPAKLVTPHVLYERLVILLYQLTPAVGFRGAGFLVAFGFYILLALVLYWLFVEMVGTPTGLRAGMIYAVSVIVLMLVTPITLFTPTNLYFGYIGINVYHSPTILLLKPFAVALFYLSYRILDRRLTGRRWFMLACLVLVSVLCVEAKPSYGVVLVPVVLVASLCQKRRHHSPDWLLLVGGIVAPIGLMLGGQALSYGTEHLEVAPLAVFDAWSTRFNSDASANLLPKFTLSILFPLVVYITHFARAKRTPYPNLAWLGFGFGAAYTYLLAESDRVEFGNLTWCGQIALFVLFVMSAIFFLEQNRRVLSAGVPEKTPAFMLCLGVSALHLVSGIVWYEVHLSEMPIVDMQFKLW